MIVTDIEGNAYETPEVHEPKRLVMIDLCLNDGHEPIERHHYSDGISHEFLLDPSTHLPIGLTHKGSP